MGSHSTPCLPPADRSNHHGGGNGDHSLSLSAAADSSYEDNQLRLTIGISPYNNEPPPSVAYSIQQNHHHRHNLQPFVFRALPSNNAPLLLLPQYPTPLAPPPQQPRASDAASTSSTNQPRRQQPRQKQALSSGSSSARKKGDTITPPYPWSTNKRCQIYSSRTLKTRGHVSITGRVKCRKCEQAYEMAFDLDQKFMEVAHYIFNNRDEMCHRAPERWMNPVLPACRYCLQESSVKPEIEGKKMDTNWLFLFLGQMLGCCTGEQLKYFCKHNGHHRTAAKDRLLYLAYLSICKQLDPDGPFDLYA